MKHPKFSSLDGRQAHQVAILRELDKARDLAALPGKTVSLQIMCFAFTDRKIAEALGALLSDRPGLRIQVLADWSQGAGASPSVVADLARCAYGPVRVRYKIDLP